MPMVQYFYEYQLGTLKTKNHNRRKNIMKTKNFFTTHQWEDILDFIPKYKDNLTIQGNDVISYKTKVAVIDHSTYEVVKLGWWSPTTSKHINYVANQLKYDLVDVEVYEGNQDTKSYQVIKAGRSWR